MICEFSISSFISISLSLNSFSNLNNLFMILIIWTEISFSQLLFNRCIWILNMSNIDMAIEINWLVGRRSPRSDAANGANTVNDRHFDLVVHSHLNLCAWTLWRISDMAYKIIICLFSSLLVLDDLITNGTLILTLEELLLLINKYAHQLTDISLIIRLYLRLMYFLRFRLFYLVRLLLLFWDLAWINIIGINSMFSVRTVVFRSPFHPWWQLRGNMRILLLRLHCLLLLW